jgi:hypothetical protein
VRADPAVGETGFTTAKQASGCASQELYAEFASRDCRV